MEKIKRLFDWCVENCGELDGMHIIDTSDFNDLTKFRIYHKDGHCIDLYGEVLDLSEDESCENIDGIYYHYNDELFDGFNPIEVEDFIKLINLK